MTLQFWPEQKKPVEEFIGCNIDQMPLLLEAGMEPISVAQLMEWRLWALDQPAEVKNAWWDNYIDCGATSAVRDSANATGNLKIEHNSATLRGINPKSDLFNGGVILTPEQYTAVEGNEYTPEQLKRSTGRWFPSAQSVADDPLWQDLVADDKHLLKEYARAVFAESKQRFKYEENMRLYVPDTAKQPMERLWCIHRLGKDFRSDASGESSLGGDYGDFARLIGVTPEAELLRERIAAPRATDSGTRCNIGGLVDAMYEHLNAVPLTKGVTKKILREAVQAYLK